jgi:hypothetical protein
MGLFKQLMIFGKTGLQGLPTRVTLFLWAFTRQGLLGSPYSQHGILQQAQGEPQYLETFRAGADPGIILSVFVAQLVGRLGSGGFWKEDYGWGVRVGRPFNSFGARRRSSVRYGTRLGDLKESWFILFSN